MCMRSSCFGTPPSTLHEGGHTLGLRRAGGSGLSLLVLLLNLEQGAINLLLLELALDLEEAHIVLPNAFESRFRRLVVSSMICCRTSEVRSACMRRAGRGSPDNLQSNSC